MIKHAKETKQQLYIVLLNISKKNPELYLAIKRIGISKPIRNT